MLLSSQFIIFKDHPFSITGPSVFVEVLIFALFVQTIASGWVHVRESSNPQLLRFVISPSAVEQFIADDDLEGILARHVEQEEKLERKYTSKFLGAWSLKTNFLRLTKSVAIFEIFW